MTFEPKYEWDGCNTICKNATSQLNEWLEEHPNVEIINWRSFAAGTAAGYYITIQYKEITDE
jgi:hypothetical protein